MKVVESILSKRHDKIAIMADFSNHFPRPATVEHPKLQRGDQLPRLIFRVSAEQKDELQSFLNKHELKDEEEAIRIAVIDHIDHAES